MTGQNAQVFAIKGVPLDHLLIISSIARDRNEGKKIVDVVPELASTSRPVLLTAVLNRQ